MLSVLLVTFPFFALVLYCALPGMLYRLGGGTPVSFMGKAGAVIAALTVDISPACIALSRLEGAGAHGGRVARIILVSTALAFLSFSAAFALLS